MFWSKKAPILTKMVEKIFKNQVLGQKNVKIRQIWLKRAQKVIKVGQKNPKMTQKVVKVGQKNAKMTQKVVFYKILGKQFFYYPKIL